MALKSARKLWALPLADKWLFVQAAALLPLVTIGLRLFGFRRMHTLLDRSGGIQALPHDASQKAAHTAAIVRMLVSRLPFVNCLPHSLTLWWMLQRQGILTELLVGVRMVEGVFQAHAWIEHEGRALNDRGDVRERFAAFEQGLAQKRRF